MDLFLIMPILVILKYPCVICHCILSNARNVRRHLLVQHGPSLLSIPMGTRRYDSDEFIFIVNVRNREHTYVNKHYACPLYLGYFPVLSKLEVHLNSHHILGKRKPSEVNEGSHVNDAVLVHTSKDVLPFPLLSSGLSSNRSKFSHCHF